jgi:hypothetical protein
MQAETGLRHLLHIVVATSMAFGLLHGPSMDFAGTVQSQAHVSPHAHHAHHMTGEDNGASGHSVPVSGHQDDANATPNCPLANVAAIQPSAPVSAHDAASKVLDPVSVMPMVSVSAARIDPPPRRTA